MNELSKNLRELREKKKLTQSDIGDYLEMSRVGYFKYEKGTAEPSITTLIKLADLYNVSLDELVGRIITQESEQLREIQKQKKIREQVKAVSEKVVKEFLNEKEADIIKRIEEAIK